MKREYLAGAVGLLVLLLALIWVFWPGVRTDVDVNRTRVADQDAADRKVTQLTPAQRAEQDWLPLEEDPAIPVVTKTCKWLVTEERRNVPQWVLLDNLRDRGQLFVEDDIRCLTAAGVTPALLDFAERYQDQNKLQGRVGRPPGQ